jgi:DNA-binding PadR family transcriptional regulator
MAHPQQLSGYDIKQAIEGIVSHFWSESYGQIYPELRRMAAEGLVAAHEAHTGERRKVTYTITAKGRKHLAAWLEKAPEPGPKRDELTLKIFFGNQTDPKTLIGHLKKQRDHAQSLMDQNRHWLVEAGKTREPCSPYPLITLRGGLAIGEAFVKWADETIAELSRMKGKKS